MLNTARNVGKNRCDMSNAALKRSKRSAGPADDYVDLVIQFPLRPLKTKSEFVQAGRILDGLIGRPDLTPGQQDYVAALVRFIEDYEQEQRRLLLVGLSPLQVLQHLMKENDMKTIDLGYILGSRGLASEVLNGKRRLSKALITRLADHFNVSPAVFLDGGESVSE